MIMAQLYSASLRNSAIRKVNDVQSFVFRLFPAKFQFFVEKYEILCYNLYIIPCQTFRKEVSDERVFSKRHKQMAA